MKIDVTLSVYHEDPQAESEFTRAELRHMRMLLRRLRFLEAQIRTTGGIENPANNGGALFAEREVEALEWLLKEVGFLPEQNRELAVSGNH